MKLFAIRLENAEMVIVTANTQREALRKAGLTAGTLLVATERLKQMGVNRDRADLVLDGIGPQRYEIRELDHLMLTLCISKNGGFDLRDTDEATYMKLYDWGYPIMSKMDDEIAKRWPDPVDLESHRDEHDSLCEDAYSREKTRLMLPPEAEHPETYLT
jgi:hypothetical protein